MSRERKYFKPLLFVNLLLIGIAFQDCSLIQATQITFDDHFTFNAIFTVNDFGNFSRFKDDSRIYSYNGGSSIEFEYLRGVVSENVSEIYILSLGDLGNVSDFSLSVVVNYTFVDLYDIASSYAIVGSYYNNDLEWVGYPQDAQSRVCILGYQDFWRNSSGRIFTTAYQYDIEETNTTELNATALSGELLLEVSRNTTGLFTKISFNNNYTEIVTKQVVHGIWKPVNYLLLSFISSGNTTENAKAIWKDFTAAFTIENVGPVIPPNTSTGPKFTIPSFSIPGYTLVIAFSSTIFLAVIVFLRKRTEKAVVS